MLTWLVESLSFRFVLFRTTGSSIECLAVKRATALLTQNVDVIKQVAWEYVRVKFGPGFQAEVDVLEVRLVWFPVERSLICVATRTLPAQGSAEF